MSSSEEFSSPDFVEVDLPANAPTALRRQNADMVTAASSFADTESSTIHPMAADATSRVGRLYNLGFGPKMPLSEFPPKFKDLTIDDNDLSPRVEWTKFFSNVWNTKNNTDASRSRHCIDIASDTSGDDSAEPFGCPALRRPLLSGSRALRTASIERKHPSPPIGDSQNGLRATKLQVATIDHENTSPDKQDAASSSKSTPPFVDPRLLMRRKMMQRPSLAKKIVENAEKEAEADIIQKQSDREKTAAREEVIKAKNMKILSVRRKMMMRPSKVKQIAQMEANMQLLEAAIAQLKSEKLALVAAEKKEVNARRLALRRKMMQRPNKTEQTLKVLDSAKPAPEKRSLDDATAFGHSAFHPDTSCSIELRLDELIERVSKGLKNGLFAADAFVSEFSPANPRGLYQSPIHRVTLLHAASVQIPPV